MSEKQQARILIACIGNIFLGDDGFGVEVARRLLARKAPSYPAHVHIVDFGIRGMDLAYTMVDDYNVLVLVDALPRGGAPGTLYLLEPELPEHVPARDSTGCAPDAHSMDPVKVLAFAQQLGQMPRRILIVGCEPTPMVAQDADICMGLSQAVSNALDEALRMLDMLVGELLSSASFAPVHAGC